MKKILFTICFFDFFLFISSVYSQNPEWINYTAGNCVTSLADENNNIWVGTTGGLVKIDKISVRINNIFFDFDKFDLKPESYPELDRLAKILLENPGIKVEIAGHTDDIGSDAYNFNLSRNRAESVVAYLVSKGCIRKNLATKGYGKSKPVSINETEEGRA